MKYASFDNDSYFLYTIETDKFKTCHMEVIFETPCTKDNLTYISLLTNILNYSTNKYNTKRKLEIRKEELYNLNLYSSVSRVGNTIITSFITDFLDPKYMEDVDIEDIISLSLDIIFNPYVTNESFDEDIFLICKNNLKEEIQSIKDSPKESAILMALEYLDENSPISYLTSGYIDILDKITPKKLYNFYKRFINESISNIYLVGNLDMSIMNRLINKYAYFMTIKTNKYSYYLDYISNKKLINEYEKNSDSETNVVQIYSFNNLTDYERDYVMPLFNLLWGSGSLNSVLYKNLRTENSLCYNVSTIYQKYDRVLLLHTSVSEKNYEKTIQICKESLKSIKDGIITKEELNNTKEMIINSLSLISDSPSKLVDNYLFKNILNLEDIEQRIDKFSEVTLDDIVNLSKKIRLVLNLRVGK